MQWSDIVELQSLSGAKEKQGFIKEHSEDEEFLKVLYYALNPLLTYNVSEKILRREVLGAWMPHTYNDIFEICDMLSSKKGVDNSVIRTVASYIHSRTDESEREACIKLLAKTLRLGVTAKTVNKVIPGLIPEWEVQQAYPLDKYPINEGTEFWLTQKLNGVRATFYDGKLVARSGVPYKGVEHIISEIEQSPMCDYVLDGELTLSGLTCESKTEDKEFSCRWKGVILTYVNDEGKEVETEDFTVDEFLKMIKDKNMRLTNMSAFFDTDVEVMLTSLVFVEKDKEIEFDISLVDEVEFIS